MTTRLPDEKLVAAWTAIEQAVRKGPTEHGTKLDDQPLANIITVTNGSDDLATYVRYLRGAVSTPSFRQLVATLDDVYELRLTTTVERAGVFDANGRLHPQKRDELEKWGTSIRTEERNWVLSLLIDKCAAGSALGQDVEVFKSDAAVRVIPFNGTDVKEVASPDSS